MKENIKPKLPEKEIQPSAYTISGRTAVVQKKVNKTGLPDNLKSGLENLSGYDLSHVRVHFNSAKPAQLQALAYTQGSEIHVAPGHEKHLPHEGWHVIQQMQGRVRPDIQLKTGDGVNYDRTLENEADHMGAQAFTTGSETTTLKSNPQLRPAPRASSRPMPFQFTLRDARKYIARTKDEFTYPEEWDGYPTLEQIQEHINSKGVNWKEINNRLNAPASGLEPKRKTVDEGSDPEQTSKGKKKKQKSTASREADNADQEERADASIKAKKKRKKRTKEVDDPEKETAIGTSEGLKKKPLRRRRRARKSKFPGSSPSKKEAVEKEAAESFARSKSKRLKEEIVDDGDEADISSSDDEISFGTADKLADHIKYLTQMDEGKAAKGPQSFLGKLEGYDWLAIHRQLIKRGELTRRIKDKKASQNQVRCTVSLTVKGEGGQRVISYHIPRTFVSGEKGMNIKNIKKWLVEKRILETEEDYSSSLHAHSEQDLTQYFRDTANLDEILAQLRKGMLKGEEAVAVILDFVSAPNTVCTPCHDSVDAVMTEVVIPYFNKALRAKLDVIINASAFGKFKGGGKQETDKAKWVETTVDYDKIQASEARARQRANRDKRRSRGLKPPADPTSEKTAPSKKSKKDREKPKSKLIAAPRDLRRQVEETYGAIVQIGGEGLNCYIRAIVTGLKLRGIIGEFPVETLVGAIAAELEDAQLRDDDGMIDAGGLDAEMVRRLIASNTQDIMDGGVDVGVMIVQWDSHNGRIATYTANEGSVNLVLFYTPGHFDYITFRQ